MPRIEYGEEDWKRDDRELDRYWQMQDLEMRDDPAPVLERRVPRMPKEKKKFVKVKLSPTSLPNIFIRMFEVIVGLERK